MTDTQYEWKPKGDRIKSIWSDNLNPDKIWQEYPRPQLERKEWTNLNGLWDYYISNINEDKPSNSEGKILVPFCIESSLSGVNKSINETNLLWYQKEININNNWKDKKHLLLHFEAVDWKSELYINNKKIGEHIGGYSPFYFDIYNFIDFTLPSFTVTLKVYDPSNKGYQPIGKQCLNPNGIWYTPTSGIWQTVWLEALNDIYIENIYINSDYDNKKVHLNVKLNIDKQLPLQIKVLYKDNILYTESNSNSNSDIVLSFNDNDFHPWSPDEPNLYSFEITLYNENKNEVFDLVNTYTGIRKVSSQKDSKNIWRIYLNNKPIYNLGTLDQGFWPDGIYTPPSEEAMIYDINKLKEMGFNTIRKHVKVENSRYYYNCDKIGMLVWQDMLSGDMGVSCSKNNSWQYGDYDQGTDVERTEESVNNYYYEWTNIINSLKFFSCIIVWVPFNEAWGQFKTEEVTKFTKDLDPSRLINSASGGNFRHTGDILDLHHYPNPDYFIKDNSKINVEGEYGGLGLNIEGHTWEKDNWGYLTFHSIDEITDKYVEYINCLVGMVNEGISGAIYTQTTDCEIEINGLITYDRKVVKVHENKIKDANLKLINSLKE